VSVWDWLKCEVFGKCRISPRRKAEMLVSKMDQSLADTKEIKHQLREIRESGIWPQDLIRGTYRAPQRKPRRGNS
jgi:hypothetical protein